MLDSYTIENETFNEQYAKATNQQKVAANINKFFEMINAKDYTSAYKVLDTEFKNNYFKTEKEFENYIEQILYKCNSIEYLKFDDGIASVFKYNIKVINRFDSTQQKDFAVAMQLKEGTNFVMSFEVN